MPPTVEDISLGEIMLFKDLSPAELARVSSYLRPASFPAGTALMTMEQPGDIAYIIRSGTVKIYVEQVDGSEVILAILGSGELIGELSLLDNIGRSATVVTLEPSSLYWMDRATFGECLHTMPQMTLNLVRILSRRLRLANAHNQVLAAQDVFGRVAHQVLAFADAYGEPDSNGDIVIPLRLTQTDLASLVGASRVRVNQVLGHYQQRNYLSVNQKYYITVHNRAALAQRCQ